jgi:hypothetical protein
MITATGFMGRGLRSCGVFLPVLTTAKATLPRGANGLQAVPMGCKSVAIGLGAREESVQRGFTVNREIAWKRTAPVPQGEMGPVENPKSER